VKGTGVPGSGSEIFALIAVAMAKTATPITRRAVREGRTSPKVQAAEPLR
jgi:hypothetical protein